MNQPAHRSPTDLHPDAAPEPWALAEVCKHFLAPPERRLDVGHSKLAYYRFGAGPDIVFVHGWPLHAATFRGLIPCLAASFTCHLVDLPGTGQTETGPNAPIGLTSHAATVRRAVDELGLGSYAMVAHDTGAAIARLLAVEDPRVNALVISGTEIPGHHPWLIKLYSRMARSPLGRDLLVGMMHSRFVQRSALGFGGCFHNLAALDGDFFDLFVAPLLRSREVALGQMTLVGNLDFDVIDSLAAAHRRIRVPTLLLWGQDDPFFPVELARAMAQELGGESTFETFADARLLVHEEHSEAFAQRSAKFLTRARSLNPVL